MARDAVDGAGQCADLDVPDVTEHPVEDVELLDLRRDLIGDVDGCDGDSDGSRMQESYSAIVTGYTCGYTYEVEIVPPLGFEPRL